MSRSRRPKCRLGRKCGACYDSRFEAIEMRRRILDHALRYDLVDGVDEHEEDKRRRRFHD